MVRDYYYLIASYYYPLPNQLGVKRCEGLRKQSSQLKKKTKPAGNNHSTDLGSNYSATALLSHHPSAERQRVV